MSVSRRFCVNMSGKTCPVYNANNQKIGDIMPREFFLNWGNEGSLTSIYFKGPSGSMLNGYLRDAPNGATTTITSRNSGTETVNGQKYSAFVTRKTLDLYNYKGTRVGSVAANKKVLCLTGTCSEPYPYRMAINYAEKRAGGWDTMADSTGSYGYVDTGMRTSTSYSGIGIYGSW